MKLLTLPVFISATAADYAYKFDLVGTDNTIRPYHAGNACAENIRNRVKLRSCRAGASSQQWSYDADTRQIKSLTGNQCWQTNEAQGSRINVATCSGAESEQFIESQGVVRRAGSIMCLQAMPDKRIKTKKCFLNMFGQEAAAVVQTPEVPTAVDVSVISVDGFTERNEFAEPWKTTSLAASATFSAGSAPAGTQYCWTIKFVENEENAARSIRLNEIENQCYLTHLLDFDFWYPGYYDVSVTVNGFTSTTTVRNLYARREVRDLSDEEWGDYVAAMWTLKNVKTTIGRELYGPNCPTGHADDYHEHEYFVMVHTTLALNKTSDQLHYGFMQEWAHQAWNTMLEQALQCVDPSVSLLYWNSVYDRINHGGDLTDSSTMAQSAIWSNKYYGGGINHADDDGTNPHYFVKDGAFANWWLSQKRDVALCDEIPEAHPEWRANCVEGLGPAAAALWRKANPEEGGFWAHEPSPIEKYQYVTRRPFYNHGIGSFFASGMPKPEEFQYVVLVEDFVNAFRYISAVLHGTAHILVSGRWNLRDPDNAPLPELTTHELGLLKNYTFPMETRVDLLKNLPYFGEGVFSLRNYEFCLGGRIRPDGCMSCTEAGCFCIDKEGCNDNDILTPADTFDLQSEPTPGSIWSLWISSCRGSEVDRNAKFGCIYAESGTFGISPFANQDPVFYPHHAFTYVMWDMLLQRIHKDPDGTSAPYYGFETGSLLEMDGHNMGLTNFMHLVPYKEGQEFGSRQTWTDILDQWQYAKREYRWDINTPHGFAQISGFESLLSNEHLYPGKTYEKNVDESLETCSGVVMVNVLGPVPYSAELTPACCLALKNHFDQIDAFGTGGGVLTEDLCVYEPTSLRCYAVAVPNYNSLAALDAMTGYDALSIVTRLTHFCDKFYVSSVREIGGARTGGKSPNKMYAGSFMNLVYLNLCPAKDTDLCY